MIFNPLFIQNFFASNSHDTNPNFKFANPEYLFTDIINVIGGESSKNLEGLKAFKTSLENEIDKVVGVSSISELLESLSLETGIELDENVLSNILEKLDSKLVLNSSSDGIGMDAEDKIAYILDLLNDEESIEINLNLPSDYKLIINKTSVDNNSNEELDSISSESTTRLFRILDSKSITDKNENIEAEELLNPADLISLMQNTPELIAAFNGSQNSDQFKSALEKYFNDPAIDQKIKKGFNKVLEGKGLDVTELNFNSSLIKYLKDSFSQIFDQFKDFNLQTVQSKNLEQKINDVVKNNWSVVYNNNPELYEKLWNVDGATQVEKVIGKYLNDEIYASNTRDLLTKLGFSKSEISLLAEYKNLGENESNSLKASSPVLKELLNKNHFTETLRKINNLLDAQLDKSNNLNKTAAKANSDFSDLPLNIRNSIEKILLNESELESKSHLKLVETSKTSSMKSTNIFDINSQLNNEKGGEIHYTNKIRKSLIEYLESNELNFEEVNKTVYKLKLVKSSELLNKESLVSKNFYDQSEIHKDNLGELKSVEKIIADEIRKQLNGSAGKTDNKIKLFDGKELSDKIELSGTWNKKLNAENNSSQNSENLKSGQTTDAGKINTSTDENSASSNENGDQNNNGQKNETNKSFEEILGHSKEVKSDLNTQQGNFAKFRSVDQSKQRMQNLIKNVEVSKLNAEISKIINAGESKQVILKLMPEALGKVEIQLDIIDKLLSAKIEVENESVRQMVQQSVDQLKESLSQNGIQLNSFNVNLSNQEDKNNRFNKAKKRQNSSKQNTKVDDKTENETPKNMGYNTYDYLV